MSQSSSLHVVDAIIMVVYFAVVVAIGLRFSRKAKTTEGIFLGEEKAPSLILGLSLIAAKISSVTFLALPAAAYVLDWRLFVPGLALIPIALLAVWILVPFFRRSAHTTAFEYLEARFGPSARLYGAIMFLVSQALRLGSVIYLAAIPIEMFTGIPSLFVMVIIGGFCTLYTLLGGIQAVIWTDAIQAIVLYAGGLAALLMMISGIPGGLPEIFQVAWAHDKFSFGPMEWNLGERTFWTMIIIGATTWIGQYTSDQVLIQRYLAAKDLRQARMAGWTSAFLCLPTWGFFFFLGTALWVYYRVSPDQAIAGMPADNVFPHFILTQMPAGLKGLVIAGVLSAAMGSLSAALNAFATVATVDVVKPYLFRNRSDRYYTTMARMLTGLAAVLMFLIGFAFSVTDKESFADLSQQITSLLGGVVPGFFLLGFFAAKVDTKVVWQAFIVGFALNVYLVLVEWQLIPNVIGVNIHPYWVSTIVLAVMLAVALVLAWLRPGPQVCPADLMISVRKKA